MGDDGIGLMVDDAMNSNDFGHLGAGEEDFEEPGREVNTCRLLFPAVAECIHGSNSLSGYPNFAKSKTAISTRSSETQSPESAILLLLRTPQRHYSFP